MIRLDFMTYQHLKLFNAKFCLFINIKYIRYGLVRCYGIPTFEVI